MSSARIIWNRSFILKGRYRVSLKVYQVQNIKKHPEGVKAKFVLVDLERNCPRLLVDNHDPYGFHMHVSLPEDETIRINLDTKDFYEAYDEFMKEVERVVKNEE